MPPPTQLAIRITTAAHQPTGILIATSRDLPGLFVAGRSQDAIDQQIPSAIREILEAKGDQVMSITKGRPPDLPPHFVSRDILVNVESRPAAT